MMGTPLWHWLYSKDSFSKLLILRNANREIAVPGTRTAKVLTESILIAASGISLQALLKKYRRSQGAWVYRRPRFQLRPLREFLSEAGRSPGCRPDSRR